MRRQSLLVGILLALMYASVCHPTVGAPPDKDSCIERWTIERRSAHGDADAKYFAELREGSALRGEATQDLGRLSAAGLRHFGETPRRLLAYLLETQIIETFAHIESKLCLVEEKIDGDVYIARVRGSHIYYTNERNEVALAFTLRANLKDGRLLLESGDD